LARTVYESMFILNPNAYAKNPSGAANTVEQLVASVGGKLLASRLWNEQKLAYPINGHRKGVYWLTYFEMESTDMAKFNRQCQLADIVMRHLAIRIDPRLADTLVAVAKGEKTIAQPTVDIVIEEEVEEPVEAE
jgi:small subunit ribosomal protein S6